MAFHELHHDEVLVGCFANLVDRADVRMVQRRRGLRLAQHMMSRLCGDARFRRKNLNCYVAFETLIAGTVNLSLSSRAEFFPNPVMAERLADHGEASPAGKHVRTHKRASQRLPRCVIRGLLNSPSA